MHDSAFFYPNVEVIKKGGICVVIWSDTNNASLSCHRLRTEQQKQRSFLSAKSVLKLLEAQL